MVKAETLHRLLLVFIVVGLAFSTYSAIETYYHPLQNTCTVNGAVSCSKVDASAYTGVGPVPFWSVGVGGFLLLLALDIPLYRTYEIRYLKPLLVVAGLGVGTAIVLGAIEVFLIGAICPICLGAYVSGVIVFVTALGIRRLRSAEDPEVSKGAREPSPS